MDDNDLARNVVISGVENTSSSHSDIKKNSFLVLVEGPAKGINDSAGARKKV